MSVIQNQFQRIYHLYKVSIYNLRDIIEVLFDDLLASDKLVSYKNHLILITKQTKAGTSRSEKSLTEVPSYVNW